ncbi:MAG: hypothetical protein JWN73_1694 [Betaproteobacteria bacterium]|nr:hypothetical protein [Betaproteobacteria bacterium]
MNNFNEINIFKAIVERGSFVAASNLLDIPKATVSRKIDELETRLGVRLLQRTTRKMHLTEAGQAYYEHCERILAEIEEAERAVGQLSATPRGNLRITAAFSVGAQFLGRLLPEFARRYPEVRVTLLLSNSVVDLVENNFDLALRAGPLTDSSYASRTLVMMRSRMLASPGYIEEMGLPRTPEDLAKHRTLALVPRDERGTRFGWRLELRQDAVESQAGKTGHGQKKAPVQDTAIEPLMVCNDPEPAIQAAIGGEGIVFVPDLFVAQSLRSGQLVRVLPQWQGPESPLSAVYPSRRGLSPKVRVFIDFLGEHLNELVPP